MLDNNTILSRLLRIKDSRRVQSEETNTESATQVNRRFRKRIVPAIVLLLFSGMGMFGAGLYAYQVVSANIEHRLIAPNEKLLSSTNERLANPRHVASLLFTVAACIAGLIGTTAWMKGNWTRAILLTIWVFIYGGLANYIGS